jgi:hypothetical protein
VSEPVPDRVEPVESGAPVAAPVIDTEMLCKRCGYNLCGLQPTGRCPECAAPIEFSMRGFYLRFADPQWLEKLALGTRLILWGLLIAIVVDIAAMFMLRYDLFLRQMIAMAAGSIGYYGIWLLTEPDPGKFDEIAGITARKVVRGALLAGIGLQVVEIAVPRLATSPTANVMIVLAINLPAAVLRIVGEVAQLAYLQRLAGRIPNRILEDRANFLKRAIGVSYGIFAAVGIVAAVIFAVGGSRAAVMRGSWSGLAVFGCVEGVVGLALLTFAIMFLILIYRLGKVFRREAANARDAWSLVVAAPELGA